MDKQSKIILISGPTASGKSNFAVKIAKKIQGEIINADSMQVYKKLKILTARPNKQEQKNIKHHLYGFVGCNEKFSTGQWLKEVIKKINEIKKTKFLGLQKTKSYCLSFITTIFFSSDIFNVSNDTIISFV